METILASNSMRNFSCIGGACEASCCKAGWNINIDKTTYDLYMTAKNDTVINFIENVVLHPEEIRSEYRYATFAKENGECKLLDNNGFCKIHSRYGVPALSNVCNTYPRVVNRVNGEFEIAWSISCPEIVRFMMNNTSTKFERVDASNYLGGVFALGHIYEQENYNTKWQYLLPEIRDVILKISLEKEFQLNERLIKIGKFVRKIQNEINENNYIFSAEEILQEVQDKNLITEVSDEKQEQHFAYLFSICHDRAVLDSTYSNFIEKLEMELRYVFTTKRYAENEINKKYRNFIENYVHNLIMQTIFPLTEGKNIFAEYSKLVINYSLLLMHINYFILDTNEIDEQYFIDTIVRFSRDMEHDSKFMGDVYFKSELQNYMNLNTMIELLSL